MNILSVDFDFFFPDSKQFDWGMSENNRKLNEMLWHIRYWEKSILSEKYAKDSYTVDKKRMSRFFENSLSKTEDPSIFVFDSHADIANILQSLNEKPIIYNFDQHHDCGYSCDEEDDKKLNCGNWVKKCKQYIEEYILIYPLWRLESKEEFFSHVPDVILYDTQFDMRNRLPMFDILFVCKSSAWVPSWEEVSWKTFLYTLSYMFPNQYRLMSYDKYAIENRYFDIKIAEKYRYHFD